MRSTLMWRGGVWVRYVGAGGRAAVVMRQAGLAATASITPVPSTPYGPTSRISRPEADSSEVAVIDVSLQVVLSSYRAGSGIHSAIHGKVRPRNVGGLRTGDKRHQRGDF